MTPYANPADRLRALYNIPTAPGTVRTLELCCERAPLPAANGPDGVAGPRVVQHVPRCASPQQLSLPSQTFDRVILHRTLDDLAGGSPADSPFDAGQFLAQVFHALDSGGLVVGCLQDRSSFKSIAKRLMNRLRMAAIVDAAGNYSLDELRQALREAGFDRIRVFTLLPDCDAPLRLVDTNAAVSSAVYRYELAAGQRQIPLLSYLVKRIALAFGSQRRFQTEFLLFWAYKPC